MDIKRYKIENCIGTGTDSKNVNLLYWEKSTKKIKAKNISKFWSSKDRLQAEMRIRIKIIRIRIRLPKILSTRLEK